MLRLENIKIYEDLTEEDVVKKACEKYNIDFSKVNNFVIYKKSIDARNKDNIFYNYTKNKWKKYRLIKFKMKGIQKKMELII